MTKNEYLLVCLSEECSEIQKAGSKAIRFGPESGQPGRDTTNAEDICNEYCDLIGIIELLEENGLLHNPKVGRKIRNKKNKVLRYMSIRGIV